MTDDDDLVDELAPGDPLQGETYRIEFRVGRGGMATVYKALRSDGSAVALKILDRKYERNQTILERWHREYRFGERLRDVAGTLPPLELGQLAELSGRPFIAFPFLKSKDLNYTILGRSMPPLRACTIARDVADILIRVHARSVLHRDVKPSNIIVRDDAAGLVVHLLDFGFARSLTEPDEDSSDVELTLMHERPGTIEFMSPEQALGEAPAPHFDVYALGTTLWKMLAGTSPFEGMPNQEILRRKCDKRGVMRSLATAKEGLDRKLVELVDQTLHPDLARRIVSAERFRDRLDEVIAALREATTSRVSPVTEPSMPTPETAPSDQVARVEFTPAPSAAVSGRASRRIFDGLAMVIAAAAIVGGSVAWSQNHRDPAESLPLETVEASASPPVESKAIEPSRLASETEPSETEPSVAASSSAEPSSSRPSTTGPTPPVRVEDSPAVAPEPESLDPRAARVKPHHQTPECESVRRAAEEATARFDWPMVMENTARKACWATTDEWASRRVPALWGVQRFDECAKLAVRVRDPRLAGVASWCKAGLESQGK